MQKQLLNKMVSLLLALTLVLCGIPMAGAAAKTSSEFIGSVRVGGNPAFDCDTVINADDSQWRWLSYPGSRMVERPAQVYDGGMSLNLGLFVDGVREFNNVQKIAVASAGQTAADWSSCETAWYPYKLTADAVYGTTALHLDEFFIDQNTFCRYYTLLDCTDADMTLSAKAEGILQREDGILLLETEQYYLAYQILLLRQDGTVSQRVIPTVDDNGNWAATLHFTEDTAQVAFLLTLGAKNCNDGVTAETVATQAKETGMGSIPEKLVATKAYWDQKLQAVPAPTVWGIQSLEANGITPEAHYRAFYAAWAFQYQNILEPTPETGFQEYQITLGKASMWSSGNYDAPNSCSWESLYSIQQMSYVEPEIAWSAMKGFINSIQPDGTLGGECLPSQKAHTLLLTYQHLAAITPAADLPALQEELAGLYEKVKTYLKWRAENPRWIYGAYNYPDEKDISFVSEWYTDVDYAREICRILGNTEDLSLWQAMTDEMDTNIRTWFFTPMEGDDPDIIYNTYFANTGTHYTWDRPTNVPNYVYSLLVANIPADLTARLVKNYLAFEDSAKPILGFTFYKYGDGCNIAYGLLEKVADFPELGNAWQRYINAALRETIRNVQFTECLNANDTTSGTEGVVPSSFGALTMVDFTYMNNGVRIDSGILAEFQTPKLQSTEGTNPILTVHVGDSITLPVIVPVQDTEGNDLATSVTWEEIPTEIAGESGTVTVQGRLTYNDMPVTATVTIKEAPEIVSSSDRFTLRVGESLQLSVSGTQATFAAKNRLNNTIGVSDSGKVLATDPGRAVVTATLASGETVDVTIVVEPVNMVDLAFGGTATASSQADSARNPEKALDNDTISMWRAGNNENSQWFQADLGKSVRADGVAITWFEGNQPQSFRLLASQDGNSWQEIYSRSAAVSSGKSDFTETAVLDTQVEARYFRIESSLAGNNAIGITQFRVFGTVKIQTMVSDISFSAANTITGKSETLALAPMVTPANASDPRLIYTITDWNGHPTAAATVSASGVVTPLSNGRVRVTATAADGSGISASHDIVITGQDIINVALKKSVWATSDGSDSKNLAVDGDRTTRWGSASNAPQESEFGIDLGVDCNVSAVAFYFDSGAYPVDYLLQCSEDGQTWNTLKSVTGNDSDQSYLTFPTTVFRYIRILSSSTTNQEWAFSIWEFEVYGVEAGENNSLQQIADGLAIPVPQPGDTYLDLPLLDGYTIFIANSEQPDVLSTDGVILSGTQDIPVNLTIAVSDGTETVYRQVSLTVPAIVVTLLPGDLNGDGQLSVTDVVLLRKAILNNALATEQPAGDLNQDGSLSVTDVVLLRKAILRKS